MVVEEGVWGGVRRRTCWGFSRCHFFSQLLVPAHLLSTPLLKKTHKHRSMSCFSLSTGLSSHSCPTPSIISLLWPFHWWLTSFSFPFCLLCSSLPLHVFLHLPPSVHVITPLSLSNPSKIPIFKHRLLKVLHLQRSSRYTNPPYPFLSYVFSCMSFFFIVHLSPLLHQEA